MYEDHRQILERERERERERGRVWLCDERKECEEEEGKSEVMNDTWQ